MMRFTIAVLFAIVAIEPALSADQALTRQGRHHSWRRVAVNLPRGLPRPRYNFRTTISYGAPYPYRQPYADRFYAYEIPDVLFTPVYADVPYIPPLVGAPLLPGTSALPGSYGSTYSYDYGGPYYGGPYIGYWDRLPYACGVYGYC
jgi:hypothetical protein